MSVEMGWCYACQEPRPAAELEDIPLDDGRTSMVIRHCRRCRRGSGSFRYVLHPGRVISTSDGDSHFVSAGSLALLYRLPPGSWTVDSGFTSDIGRTHLFPQDDHAEYDRIARELEEQR